MLAKTRPAGTLISTIATLGLIAGASANAQSMSEEDIVEAMQDGGYVLVMNAAESAVPEAGGGGGRGGFGGGRGGRGGGPAGPRLTDHGEGTVVGMRFALREFRIHIGQRLSGPDAPAAGTAQAIEYGELETLDELSEEAAAASGQWLRSRASQRPEDGTNTIIVTQAANIESAFGSAAANLEDGEALLIGADGEVLGRIEIEEWSRLAIS